MDLFNFFCLVLQVTWRGPNIVVFNDVIIKPPYKAEDINGNPDSRQLKYVKKIVEKFLNDQADLDESATWIKKTEKKTKRSNNKKLYLNFKTIKQIQNKKINNLPHSCFIYSCFFSQYNIAHVYTAEYKCAHWKCYR